MKTRIAIIIILTFLTGIGQTIAQTVSQTVRGEVIDTDSRQPLPGATVIILNSDPIIGASTDLDGKFRMDNVPLGRVTVKISYLGYEDMVIPNILVGAAKEIIFTVELEESLIKMDEIVVKANDNKAEVNNEMTLVSARTFSVEETGRFAGSFDDPARMVAGFAGVTSDAEGDNDIVVRGNSPKGILWRLEGVEIPNPNHFSEEGSTGGPINALNSNMLANSEFYSGAFAPEYGNAYSGVFDMKLRKGNDEKREYSIRLGVLGTDATLEGPFSKKGKASYLVNYRYSTLALLDKLNFVDFQGIPNYQDATFKLYFPTKNAGIFSVFGLGGISSIDQKEEDSLGNVEAYNEFKSKLGVAGINHLYSFNVNTYIKNSVSVFGNSSGDLYRPLNDSTNEYYDDYKDNLGKKGIRFNSTLHKKLSAKDKVKIGVIYTLSDYSFTSEYFNEDEDRFVKLQSGKGKAGQIQAFFSWKHRFTEDLSMVGGIHYQHFFLNNTYSVEPRLAFKWELTPKQAISAGAGIHSKLESLTTYLAINEESEKPGMMPNRDLEIPKAFHAVLGYERTLAKDLYLKAEAYYQYLFDVPVENDPTSNYSQLNSAEWFTTRELVNEGVGMNYGIELTLEKFFSNNYYFLITASLYESKYKALDGVLRNTRFNGNYVVNVIGGKEFQLGDKEKHKTLSINTRISLIGGKRYVPVLLEESIAKGEGVYDSDNAWEAKGDDIFLANLAISYRKDNKKVSHEIKLDVQNVTNNQGRVYGYYNNNTQSVQYGYQLPILPVFSYMISF